MRAIKKFIVWFFKTVLYLGFVVTLFGIWISSFKFRESTPLSEILFVILFLSTCGLVIWASWQCEYQDGWRCFFKWLGGKMRSANFGPIFDVHVSEQLSKVTSQLHKDLLFDESKISEFKELVAKEPISEEKKKKFLKQQFEKVVKRCSRDRKLDDKEWAVVIKSRKFFECEISENGKGLTRAILGDFRARGIISEGRLIEQHADTLPIKKNPGERVFLVLPAKLLKRKNITQRVNYSGVTASVNLGMGFRYRVGTIRPKIVKSEMVFEEDHGVFFVTSEKLGFHGDRKSWATTFSTLNDVQVEEDVGLEIFKVGRENPVLIFPMDLDLAAAVVNTVMNGEYEIDNSTVEI